MKWWNGCENNTVLWYIIYVSAENARGNTGKESLSEWRDSCSGSRQPIHLMERRLEQYLKEEIDGEVRASGMTKNKV